MYFNIHCAVPCDAEWYAGTYRPFTVTRVSLPPSGSLLQDCTASQPRFPQPRTPQITTACFEHVSGKGELKNGYRILFGKPEGKRPLGNPEHRWEKNIKMTGKRSGGGGMELNQLVQEHYSLLGYRGV
jgi:hypothetical protein